jgi:hypothetical protein
MPASPSSAGSSDASRLISSASPHHAHNVMRMFHLGSSHGGVAVSNTDDRRFDSFRACFDAPGNQSGHQHLDNCRDIVVEASATWLRHGSVAPWVAAGCRPAVFRHKGSIPSRPTTRVTPDR